MRLTFRQGIARYQTDIYATPKFLVKSSLAGDFINLVVSPDPTIIIFAHRAATYIVEESKTVIHAWGPFAVGAGTKWLYWDISLLDASLTRSFTAHPPITTGNTPLNPVVDQHWYDTGLHQMKVWNGSKWVDKIRVFSATYSSSAIIQPMPLGTQANETNECDAGNLVLDSFGKPLRQADGSFVTSTTLLSVVNSASKPVKFEADYISGMAEEYIPKYSFVQVRTNRRFKLARSDDWLSRVTGIVTEDLFQSEIGNATADGLVRNEQWNWPINSVGRPIFCGITGQITLTPPVIGVNQITGYVYDKDSIFVHIQVPIILDDISAVPLIVDPSPNNAPIADFYTATTIGTVPFTANFTSTSLHQPTTIQWDIGNTGTYDGSGNTFSYTFQHAGVYTVRLHAVNAFGQDDEVKVGYITINAAPTRGLRTNLDVQLGGPLQVAKGQIFTVSFLVSNDGKLAATQVLRVATLSDIGTTQVSYSGLSTGSTNIRGMNTTIITFPQVAIASGAFANTAFQITAPNSTGTIIIRAAVSSPESDSNLDDNAAELSVKVR